MQIKRKAKVRIETQRVKRAAGRAAITTYKQAGAMVYRIARNSIQRRKNKRLHSPPGMPPYTHTGALKKSIRFAATKDDVVAGPTLSGIGLVANLHEFGGSRAATGGSLRPRQSAASLGGSRSPRRNNWKLQIGGHGPVEIGPRRWVSQGNKSVYTHVRFAKLETAKQVTRAKQIAADAERILIMERLEDEELDNMVFGSDPVYPERPFMGPALIKAAPYLPPLWRNAIRNE